METVPCLYAAHARVTLARSPNLRRLVNECRGCTSPTPAPHADLTLSTGASTTSAAGKISFTTGSGTASGGSILFSVGATTGGAGGAVTMVAGDGGNANTGGGIYLVSGGGTATSGVVVLRSANMVRVHCFSCPVLWCSFSLVFLFSGFPFVCGVCAFALFLGGVCVWGGWGGGRGGGRSVCARQGCYERAGGDCRGAMKGVGMTAGVL